MLTAEFSISLQEYQVELNTISHKEKKARGADAITLTSVQKNEHKPVVAPTYSNNVYDNAGSATPPPK